MARRRGNFIQLIAETIDKNMQFLKTEGNEAIVEAVNLVEDAINYVSKILHQENFEEVHAKSAMVFFVFNTLMPVSYSILLNLLIGNIPTCLRELRFILESLAKCYIADISYPEKEFFQEKIELLKGKREHQIITEFDQKLGLNKEAITLWGKLSEEVHLRRYVERIVENVIQRSNIPPYALALPMPYDKKDLEDLNELGKRIQKTREIIKQTIAEISKS